MARNNIARLNPDGTLDTAFDPNTGAFNPANSIPVEADGKILVGGFFSSIGRQPRLDAGGAINATDVSQAKLNSGDGLP